MWHFWLLIRADDLMQRETRDSCWSRHREVDTTADRPPSHADVMAWKRFPQYWPFVTRIQRSMVVDSPHTFPWCPCDVIVITVTAWWAQWRLKLPAFQLFTQSFFQAHIKEITKAPRHWPLWVEFTGDKGPVTRKMFPFDNVIMVIFNTGLYSSGLFFSYGLMIDGHGKHGTTTNNNNKNNSWIYKAPNHNVLWPLAIQAPKGLTDNHQAHHLGRRYLCGTWNRVTLWSASHRIMYQYQHCRKSSHANDAQIVSVP